MVSDIFKGRTLLIVEDDPSSRLYLNKILENSGARILNAENGQEAVAVALKYPEIDIILMDIQLPVMDGYMSAKMIREFRKDIIIIAQTAYGLHGDKEKIMNSGFNDFMIKPIMSKTLEEKILNVLRKPG